ncbi:putative hydrolase of the HAD superfamily [Paraperlucidibaca baekdonensis]|uniref:Putative hydrolase of the HAD superfamily n=1 Tax=Paraperlucidibaca baekdonensis TaxID=748120 RepID=A0A3E0H9M7_9GAMM|nr:GMP/IMP nucleotidase [Paraperlucidibaca baekdonensis]REH40406.1 putative hydrolase of the HAD superfamily [Paraperlucidibaca baekdonensis]
MTASPNTALDWAHIDTVILDMDGTVLDLHFDNIFWMQHLPALFAEHNGLPREQGLCELLMRFQKHQGQLNWYCTDFWSEQVGFDIVPHKHTLKHLIRERADAFAFLAAVKASGRRLILATNAHRSSLELKLAVQAFGDYFDAMVSSHDYGHAKEAQAFWQQLCTQQRIDPARSVFVDDSEAVLDSAAEFGIAACICVSTPDSEKPMRKRLRYSAIDQFAELGEVPALTQGQRMLSATAAYSEHS